MSSAGWNEEGWKCEKCGEIFEYTDEVVGLDCDGHEVSLSEEDVEKNANNPDYLCHIYCNICFEEIGDENKSE